VNINKFGLVLKRNNMKISKRKIWENDTEYISTIFTIEKERDILNLQSSYTKKNGKVNRNASM